MEPNSDPLSLLDLSSQAHADAAADLSHECDVEISVRRSRTSIAERVRGWEGELVSVSWPDGAALTLVCEAVGAISLVGRDDQGQVVIALGPEMTIACGVSGGAREPRGRSRLGLSLGLRDWTGLGVAVGGTGGRLHTGELTELGADHVVLRTPSGLLLMPWSAVRWVRPVTPLRRGASC